MLVQRLARAEPEPETPRIHRFERRRRLGDDRRVVPEPRRGYAGPETEVSGSTQGAEPTPHKSALPLIRGPGMEVVRGHYRSEPRLLRYLAVLQQIRRMKLLEHRRIAYRAGGLHTASCYFRSPVI